MKRILVVVLLVVALAFSATSVSCDNKNDATALAVFAGVVVLLGVTMGGWFQNDYNDGEAFPPDKYTPLPYENFKLTDSVLSDRDFDWYRTELMRPGDRLEIWSESEIGVRALLIDEDGRYYPTDNPPGTNFHLEIQAPKTTYYYLRVEGFPPYEQGWYELWWKYKFD